MVPSQVLGFDFAVTIDAPIAVSRFDFFPLFGREVIDGRALHGGVASLLAQLCGQLRVGGRAWCAPPIWQPVQVRPFTNTARSNAVHGADSFVRMRLAQGFKRGRIGPNEAPSKDVAVIRAVGMCGVMTDLFCSTGKQPVAVLACQKNDGRTWPQRHRMCPGTVPGTNRPLRVAYPMMLTGKGDTTFDTNGRQDARLTHEVPFGTKG